MCELWIVIIPAIVGFIVGILVALSYDMFCG